MIFSNDCENDTQTAKKVESVLDNHIWIPIQNFSINELKCKCGCDSVKIQEYHLLNLQVFRNYLCKKYGKNIRLNINSGYRCEKHNKEVGGVSDSRHTFGDATDVASSDMNISGLFNSAKEIQIFSTVIKYNKSKFVHLDSRPNRMCKAWEVNK